MKGQTRRTPARARNAAKLDTFLGSRLLSVSRGIEGTRGRGFLEKLEDLDNQSIQADVEACSKGQHDSSM